MKHCTTDKCPQILDSSCVFYEGRSLIFSGINTNDSVETVIQKLNLKLESIPVFNSNNYYNKVEINNIIKGYIPLSGTLPNYPVIGDIEFSPGYNVKLYSNDGAIVIDDGFITLSSLNNNNVIINYNQVFLNSGNFNNRKFINFSQELNYIPLQSNLDGPGLVGQNYYGNNYVDNSFVQKKFVIDTFNNIDLSNYYTKNEVDVLFNQTYDFINNSFVDYNNTIQTKFLDYYTKVEINSQFLNYYTKIEVDTALATKQANLGYTPENVANKSDSYTASSSTTYASSKALVDGLVTKQDRLQDVTGNTGVGKTDVSAIEKLDVNGNLKANSYKFNLPSSITAQPNMLITKTDGNGLIWYNNSSVGAEIPSYSSPTNGYVARWDGAKFVNGSVQDDGTKIGIGTNPDSASSPARVRINPLNSKFFSGLDTNNMAPPGTIDFGDIYGSYGDIYLKTNRGNNQTTNDKKGNVQHVKITGLQNDYIITVSGTAAGMAKFVDMKRFFSYGTHLALSGYLYNKTVLGQYISAGGDASTGLTLETTGAVHPDMWEGALFTAGNAQLYIDLKGNVFSRGNPSALGGDGVWRKIVSERVNTNTALKEKLVLSRVKLKSYTKSERDALTNKEVGEIIWQTDSGNSGIRVFDGTNWLAIQTTID